MRLRRIRDVGRYMNPETERYVNVKKGTRIGRGTDYYFYLFRGGRVFIDEKKFYDNWEREK